MEGWVQEAAEEGDDIVRTFDALQVVIRSLLKIVVIDLEPNDNAQAIFEVLNARGTELLAVDLIKNLAFTVAETRRENVLRLYEAYWQSSTPSHGVEKFVLDDGSEDAPTSFSSIGS